MHTVGGRSGELVESLSVSEDAYATCPWRERPVSVPQILGDATAIRILFFFGWETRHALDRGRRETSVDDS